MRRPLTVALLMLVILPFGGAAICRSKSLTNSQVKSRDQKKSRAVKLRLGLLGFLPLPEGYKAYYTGRTVDAWGGYILSPDGSLKIE